MTQEMKQNERAILREKFLRMFKYLQDKESSIEISTYQGANVNGTFRSIDYDISNLHVKNLKTPIGFVPEALLRTSDIVYFKFALHSNKLSN